jgi:hypothetical protein
MTDNDDNLQSKNHIPDFKKIKSEADAVKTKTIKEQVEFLLGKKDPSKTDIINYSQLGEWKFRSAAFFLDNLKFMDFARIFTSYKSKRPLEDGDGRRMIGYIHKFGVLELRFIIRVWPYFPNGTRPPSVQSKIKRMFTKDEVWAPLSDSLHKTGLNEKTALEALNKVLPNMQRMIDETEILVWNKLENVKIMGVFFMSSGIWDSIQYKINQITPKGTRFKRGFLTFGISLA